jgi:folate-dependent phosphoribosylglycinamide formyltransferase PurN
VSNSPKNRVAVAVSGSGRSLQNFLDKAEGSEYEISGVIASRGDCRGCEIAKENGLPLLVESFSFKRLDEVSEPVYKWLKEQKIEWVALAGFLKPFPVQSGWEKRIINIHPALLPKHGGKGMYGERVHEAVIEAGDKRTGATIHFVNDKYDEGPIIAQVMVKIPTQLTPHELADRVFGAECELYPKVLDKLVSGSLPNKNGSIERYHHEY